MILVQLLQLKNRTFNRTVSSLNLNRIKIRYKIFLTFKTLIIYIYLKLIIN